MTSAPAPTTVPLSVLDVSLIEQGRTAAQSLSTTVAAARHAEQLGCHRYWVAEHHAPGVASASPAVVIAVVASATSSIRVGAGGVLLPNHVPMLVAEDFGTLGAFFPGRIDLGIGRGAGTQSAAVSALLRHGAPEPGAGDHRRDLEALLGSFAATDPDAVPVTARPATSPEVWALGSSTGSATLAAELGLPLCFAHHIRPTATVEAVAAYREHFRPSARLARPWVMLSVATVVADTDADADALARPFELYLATQLSGASATGVPTPRVAAAQTLPDQQEQFLAARRGHQVQGGPATARRQLADLLGATAPDELIALTPVYDLPARQRSLAHVADALRALAPVGAGTAT
jgi:luciferase family oxidoreductase group 1